MPSVNKILHSYQTVKFTKPAIKLLKEQFILIDNKNTFNKVNYSTLKNFIELKNLNFSYGDKDIFKNYLKEDLFPYIPRGSYLRLDNAKFHHDSKAEIADKSIETIADIAAEFDVTLLYLPAYSPDLNPIEKKWAQLKYWYRKLRGKHKLKRELLESLLGIAKNASLI